MGLSLEVRVLEKVKMTQTELQRCMIAYQFRFEQSPQDRKRTIRRVFDRLRCIQYDPLSTVMPNADLVLSARVNGYRREDLWSLLYEDRLLYDYWDKNMSIIPIETWPYLSAVRKRFEERYDSQMGQIRQKVRDYLGGHEYICSSDLEEKGKVDWYWAPAKATRAVLESMYHEGELLIHHRTGSRKYYCRAEEVIPKALLQAEPFESSQQYESWYLRRRLASVGVARLSSPDVFLGTGLKVPRRRELAQELFAEGELLAVELEGVSEPLVMTPEAHSSLEHPLPGSFSRLIAPLDSFLWDRRLIEMLFDFSYRWEVYTPRQKRSYGYYVLPLLSRKGFIGRMEPVYDKDSRTLRICGWWPEKDFTADEQGVEEVSSAVGRLAESLGSQRIAVDGALLAREPWLKALLA